MRPILIQRCSWWALSLILGVLFSFWSHVTVAQANRVREELVIAALAPYTAPIQQDILLVSENSPTLAQLGENRRHAHREFQALISHFDRESQAWFYELTRYPEVLHTLAIQPTTLTQAQVEKLLPANASLVLRTSAWNAYHRYGHDLVQANTLYQQAQVGFEHTINPLPEPTQQAFRHLAALPDVLTLLTDHLDLTQKLGEQHKAAGSALLLQLTALHDSLAVQDQFEAAALRKEMAHSPQAAQQLSRAAQSYAKVNGYVVPPVPADGLSLVVATAYAKPYSYWFGYPAWYKDVLWYPEAYWIDFGLAFQESGATGRYGFPPYGFATWFFKSGQHHTYQDLYKQFSAYYNRQVAQNRVVSPLNSGLIDVVNRFFNPNCECYLHFLSSAKAFARPKGAYTTAQAEPAYFSNASTYHALAWGSVGGGMGAGLPGSQASKSAESRGPR